jgi:hypothetical protein
MRIKKSRLLMTFEALCKELEQRSLRDIDLCAFHTRLTCKTAYALSLSKHQLFVVLSQAEATRHVQLITMKLGGQETTYKAQCHVIHEDAIKTLAFVTATFFYEGMRTDNLQDLYQAFPDLDDYRHVVEINTQDLDLNGFLT